MLVLFTDFGWGGPYVGQMKAVLARIAPMVPVVDLMHDAPTWNPKAASYLLPQVMSEFPLETVIVGVVDPGVGSEQRLPVAMHADGRWFVGPGNGLFELVRRRAVRAELSEIVWRPQRLSASFHGRDLYAPIAAWIATGALAPGMLRPHLPKMGLDWPDDLAEFIHFDRFGNAITGLRASVIPANARLVVRGRALPRARVFSDVQEGEPFFYENSMGLLEVAVNQGRAEDALCLRRGDGVDVVLES